MKKKTAKGRTVDFDVIKRAQGETRAVGNMNVNASGDEIDSNNRVVRTKDQILQSFYVRNNMPTSGGIGETSDLQPDKPETELKITEVSAADRASKAAADIAKKRKEAENAK
jgi:hypothetical protein